VSVIQPIADEASHEKALRRAEQLWDAAPGSPAERELDALATLIDIYEQRTFPIEALGPLDAIRARCEYLGWKRRDLEPLIGSRSRVSEVLSGRRPLTLAMIRRLHEALDIPADILIAEVSPSASKRPLPRAKKRANSTRNAAERGVAAVGQLARASRSVKARS
jgi:HTH-type transcriptional regulator/antitoxin HigA